MERCRGTEIAQKNFDRLAFSLIVMDIFEVLWLVILLERVSWLIFSRATSVMFDGDLSNINSL